MIRFGVKWEDDDMTMTVRAVEHERRIAELVFFREFYEDFYTTYWNLVEQANQWLELDDDEEGYRYFKKQADRIERCGLAHEEMEHRVGRQLQHVCVVTDGDTAQLDLEELARFWRISVMAAGRKGSDVMASACTAFIYQGGEADPRVAKAWKLPAFRSGVFVEGPIAYMQTALPAAANPPRPLFSNPRHPQERVV